MSILADDAQKLTLRINELEEIITELKNGNEEKAKIIAEQAKLIEELKAKLARYENPHTPSSGKDIRSNQNPRNQRGVVLQIGIGEQQGQHLSPTGWWRSLLSNVTVVELFTNELCLR